MCIACPISHPIAILSGLLECRGMRPEGPEGLPAKEGAPHPRHTPFLEGTQTSLKGHPAFGPPLPPARERARARERKREGMARGILKTPIEHASTHTLRPCADFETRFGMCVEMCVSVCVCVKRGVVPRTIFFSCVSGTLVPSPPTTGCGTPHCL